MQARTLTRWREQGKIKKVRCPECDQEWDIEEVAIHKPHSKNHVLCPQWHEMEAVMPEKASRHDPD